MTTETDIRRGALIDWTCSMIIVFGGVFLLVTLV